jgi:hypothetical protein
MKKTSKVLTIASYALAIIIFSFTVFFKDISGFDDILTGLLIFLIVWEFAIIIYATVKENPTENVKKKLLLTLAFGAIPFIYSAVKKKILKNKRVI